MPSDGKSSHCLWQGEEHLWKVLYKFCSFCPDPLTNMADTGKIISDWLILKNLLLIQDK
jgi:hypothetical protein